MTLLVLVKLQLALHVYPIEIAYLTSTSSRSFPHIVRPVIFVPFKPRVQ
jgi:hypothetical protein